MKIDLDGGKYTVVQKDNGSLDALRYGEPWRDLTGDNLVYWMAVEIERLRDKIEEANNCLVCAVIGSPVEVIENTLSILNDVEP